MDSRSSLTSRWREWGPPIVASDDELDRAASPKLAFLQQCTEMCTRFLPRGWLHRHPSRACAGAGGPRPDRRTMLWGKRRGLLRRGKSTAGRISSGEWPGGGAAHVRGLSLGFGPGLFGAREPLPGSCAARAAEPRYREPVRGQHPGCGRELALPGDESGQARSVCCAGVESRYRSCGARGCRSDDAFPAEIDGRPFDSMVEVHVIAVLDVSPQRKE